VEIDASTLPDGYVLASPARVAGDASSASPVSTLGFEMKIKPQAEKPVREMLKQEIHVSSPGNGKPTH
jgi:hypothetical protein